MNPGLIKNFVAAGSIVPARFCTFGANVGEVVQAAGSAAPLLGVSAVNITPRVGGRVELTLGGIYEVEAGAAFPLGAPLTADAQGRAVAAAPAAGVNAWIAGLALEPATAAGDRVRFLLAQSRLQG